MIREAGPARGRGTAIEKIPAQEPVIAFPAATRQQVHLAVARQVLEDRLEAGRGLAVVEKRPSRKVPDLDAVAEGVEGGD